MIGKPAGGGVGRHVARVGEELDAFVERHRLVAFIPLCPGRIVTGLGPSLAADGFALTHRRTKHARTMRFARLTAARDA